MANYVPFADAPAPFADVKGMGPTFGEAQPSAPPPRPNVFTSGISAGAYGALGDVGSLGEVLGRVTGWQGLQNGGAGLADWAKQWGQAVGRPDLDQQGWFDNGASGFLTKGAYEASKMIPLGLAGMLTGGAAPEAGLATRAALGAAPMFPSAVAGQYESAKQSPGGASADDALRSLALGGPLSLIQGFAPAHLSANLTQKVAGNFWARVGRESLIAGAAGSVGAGSQAAADVAFRDDLDPAQKRQQIIDSTIQGGVMTGLIGGGIAAVRGKTEGIAPQSGNDAISQAIDAVVGPNAQQAPASMPQSDAPQRAQQAYREASAGMPGGQANLIPEFLQRFNKGADQPPNPVTQSVEQYYRDMVARGGPPENPNPVVPFDPNAQPRDPMYNRQGFTNWYEVTDPAQFLTSVRAKRAQPDLGPGATEPVTVPPEAPAANVVPFDGTRTALAPQQGREVGPTVSRFQRLLPDSQATNPLEFYNEVLDRVNGGHITADVSKLAETFGIGRDLDEDLLQAQHSGDEAEAARIQKQIVLRDASLRLRENPTFRAQLEQQHMDREAQSTPETTQPRSTIYQVEQYVKENSIPGAEVVPHKQIIEALSRSPDDGGPGLAPGDIRAALIALHNDPDNGFEMRNGKGSTAGSIMINGKMLRGMRYTGSEDLRDAVQKPSSAGVDVQEPSRDGATVGSGNTEGFEPARARADQIQEQAPPPDEGARAADVRQGIQDGTINPIPLPEDAKADVDDVMNEGASAAIRRQLDKIMQGGDEAADANKEEPWTPLSDANKSKIGSLLDNHMSRGDMSTKRTTNKLVDAQAKPDDLGIPTPDWTKWANGGGNARDAFEQRMALAQSQMERTGKIDDSLRRELMDYSQQAKPNAPASGPAPLPESMRRAVEARQAAVGGNTPVSENSVQISDTAPAGWTPPAEPFKGTFPGVKKAAAALGVDLPNDIGPKDKRWPLLEDQMTSAWNTGRRGAWDSPTFTNAKATIDGILGGAGDMRATAAARQAELDKAAQAQAQVAEANRERTKAQVQQVTLAQLAEKFLGGRSLEGNDVPANGPFASDEGDVVGAPRQKATDPNGPLSAVINLPRKPGEQIRSAGKRVIPIKSMTGQQALDQIQRNMSQSKTEQQIFDALIPHLEKLVSDVPMHVLSQAEVNAVITRPGGAAGYYSPTNDHVVVVPNASGKVILHEYVHAATYRGIHMPGDPTLRQEIDALSAHVQANTNQSKNYGFTNADEFIAEAFSNPAFQKLLQSVPVDKRLGLSNGSVWSQFVNYIRAFLGVPSEQTNALEAAINLGERAMWARKPEEREAYDARNKGSSISELSQNDSEFNADMKREADYHAAMQKYRDDLKAFRNSKGGKIGDIPQPPEPYNSVALSPPSSHLGELFSRFLGDESGSLNINDIGFSRKAGQIRSNAARYKNANVKPPEPTVPQALDRVGDTGTFAEALGQLVNNADNTIRRAMGMSTDPMARKDSALRQAAQTLDKFKDLQAYETQYDQRMGGNIGVIRSEKQNTRAIHQQLSQAPVKVLNASFEALRKLPYFPEVQRMLGTMTEFGVDPFKPLDQQPHVDGMPDVQRVRAAAAHAEMQAVVNKLAQTPGGIGVQQVQNLMQLGRVQRYQDVTNMHGMVAQSYPEVPLPPSPGRAFMQDVAARNDINAREKFMQKAAGDTYAAVDQFLTSGRQRAIEAGLAATSDLTPLPGESPLKFAERKNAAANETLKAFDQQYAPLIDLHSQYGKMLTEATTKPYFPMAHSGPYMVSFHLPAAEDGTPDIAKTRELQDRFIKEGFGTVGLNPLSSQPHVMASFENPTVMQRFADLVADAREAGLVDKDKPIYNGPKSRADNFGVTALPIMQRMVDNLANSPAFKPKPGADPETIERMAMAQKEAVDALRASLMDQMPDNSLVRADSLRANVQGYDKQMYRSIAKRQEQSNAAMANMTTLQSRLQAMSKMQDIVDAAKAVPGAAGAKNAIELQDVLNGVRERAQPQSAASANGFWNSAMNKFMGIAHSVMIGVSPGYHILQMSQILTRLFPVLASKQNVSPVAAFNAIARNTPMAYKVMAKIISSGDAVTLNDLTKMGMKQPQAQAFLKVLNDGQISASTFSNQLNAQAQGSMPTAFSKLQHMANSTASWSETVPRIIAALAAHDIHTNRFNPDQRAKISASDYMNSVVRGSMYDWGDETQLPAVRALGPFGKLAGQFHQYQAKSLNQYYQMALGAFGKGGVPQDEALRWIGAHAAAVMTISGTLGLPMLGWMADAVTKASGLFNGGESYDVKAHFRNYLAAMMGDKLGDVVAHGLPSLAGWATGKYGDAELAPFSRLLEDRRKMEDSLPDYLANANGATINYGANILMGARDMINGQYAKGTARMMPTALRSAINAYKMTENGYTNAQGQTIEVSPDARDIMLTALGLKPADIEKHQEKAASIQGAREEAEYRATMIKQNLAMAFERNQPEQAKKWQAEAQAYDADPAHFNRRILPGFMSYYQNRQKALAYARATGLPLGTPQNDYNARNLTRY